ncbi:MAG: hypothetical protein ABIN89_04195 [Chitinophagaceae bacterium]
MTQEIAEDITTLSVTADKFPEGVKDAYEKLASHVPDFQSRHMYGVAEQLNGGLLYKACVHQNSVDEPGKYKVDSYTIPKGTYLFSILINWQEHMDLFSKYFEQLLAHPDAKKNSIGVESYLSSVEVILMVQKDG